VTLEMGANGECEPNQGAKHVHMEMPQWNPLCNYHIQIKMFLKEEMCA
jgi:hypothetical protein